MTVNTPLLPLHMAFSSSCLCSSLIPPNKIDYSVRAIKSSRIEDRKNFNCFRSNSTELFGQSIIGSESEFHSSWNFLGGSIATIKPRFARLITYPGKSGIHASWLTASNAFTLGTIAVMPFYALMIAAPKSELTKKSMESGIPFLALGLLYTYILYLSWTPKTIRLMFASPYWLPELPGIAKMFASEMTLASAWIHLLVVDLFAARQIFQDGLRNEIETRHSVTLCLFFCPVGIVAHFITKALTSTNSSSRHES